MKGKKILFISSEVIPYMPQTEIATMTYALPKMVNEHGGQTRIFIPKYGIINERRHQLHEVIRLSGINLIIDDMDMPLILKLHPYLKRECKYTLLIVKIILKID